MRNAAVRQQQAAAEEAARRKKEADEVARKQREAEEAARIKKEADDKARKQKEEEEAARRQQAQAAERQRLAELAEQQRVQDELDRRKKEAARKQRFIEDALTTELYTRYTSLVHHCPLVIRYEECSERARVALEANNLYDANVANARRSALNYTLEEGRSVLAMQKQSNQLRSDLEKRYQDLVQNVSDSLNIERSVLCAEHIDKTRKICDSILNSTVLSTSASSGLGGLAAVGVLSSRNMLSVVPNIPWECVHASSKDDLIGSGTYGLVYRAVWMPNYPSTSGSEAVAVKLTTRSVAEMRGMDYDLELKRASREADRIVAIAARGGDSLQVI